MPPTDMHFKYLIAAGLSRSVSLREIHFVSLGMDRITERAKSLFQPSISNVISYHPSEFGSFTTDDRNMNLIGRPVPERANLHIISG